MRGNWQLQERSLSTGLEGAEAPVEVIRDLSRLEALEEQWHALAAAPLVLRRHGLAKQLEYVGYQLCEPQRLIARDNRSLQLLFKVLRGLPYPFILRGVPGDCEEVQQFRTAPGLGLRVVVASKYKNSFVPFDGSSPDLEARMSASRRSTLRRKQKAAERHGAVRFTIMRPSPEEVPKLLDEIFRVESSGWKGNAATGLQHDREQASFFRMYCGRASREGILRLGFMSIGEATAAVRLDAVWGNKSWEFKIGYDERFADCSPGLLLSHEALKHGQAEGLLGHHFLGNDEAWHDAWAAEKTERVSLRHYCASPAGGLALLQDSTARLRRTLEKRF
jgi:CelD/BcsL family acetyltransferase involved in cellulose biosynthesis